MRDTRVGITLNLTQVYPNSTAEADLDAARRIDGMQNRIFLDPLFRAAYPEDVLEDLDGVEGADTVQDGDLKAIAAPLDFLGVNYYTPMLVAGGGPRAESAYVGSPHVVFVDGGRPRTSIGWEIDERGLLELLLRLKRDYPALPLYITENGAAFDESVRDTARVAYLHSHLQACAEAIDRGVPLRGYFVWSLLDNFEWAYGYAQRFGIVHVDFETQRRTLKDSARWYAGVVARGRL
jgi:beta-glucosidase